MVVLPWIGNNSRVPKQHIEPELASSTFVNRSNIMSRISTWKENLPLRYDKIARSSRLRKMVY